jgi:hypothetical protein
MSWTSASCRGHYALLLVLLSFVSISHSQWLEGSLKDVNNRSDYLIVAPSEFVSAVQPLVAYRTSHNSLTVSVVLTDSIYAQFPSVSPDSSIRAFLTYAHSMWRQPAPAYVLLAGNTTLVPTHMEASFFIDLGEDSAAIDQWYVDTLFAGDQVPLPTTALGRFPAWNSEELTAMVAKTIQYESANPFPHADRFITVADVYNSMDFEPWAVDQQTIIAPVWTDTVTISLRSDSPRWKTTSQFIGLWNEGAAAINFIGPANNVQYSGSAFFTSADISSLADSSSTTFCFFMGGQRYQKTDTVAVAVNLLRATNRGAVGVFAPSGLNYATENADLTTSILTSLVTKPGTSIGRVIMQGRQNESSLVMRRETLLGDPALVIQHKTIASVTPPFAEPGGFQLFQNYPNPFNPVTTIKYTVAGAREAGAGISGFGARNVELKVYDVLGREVATLVNETQTAGTYEIKFDASSLATGVYLYRLKAGESVQTKTLCVIK